MANRNKGHNIFISHHHRDEEKIPVLKRLLRMRGNTVRDSSIYSDRPNRARSERYIKHLLGKRIGWAGKIIIMIGKDTHTRKWVDWEIERAHRKDKQIIGMYIDGCEDAELPPSFDKCADYLIDWDGDKLDMALKGKPVPWCNTSGSDRQPVHELARENC